MAAKNVNLCNSGEAVLLSRLLGMEGEQAEKLQTAASLIERFGGFSEVLDAPPGQLQKTDGIDEKAADFITLLPDVARAYFDGRAKALKRVYNTEAAREVLMPKFIGRKTEVMAVLILNSRGQVVYDSVVAEGAISCVPVYIRQIVALCIDHNADTVVIAHNHPSGSVMPSKSDFLATEEIAMALMGIDVTLYDHIIFSERDYLSLRDSDMLKKINENVVSWRKRTLSPAAEG